MVVDAHFVVQIPDAMPLDAAAPLLCAGISVYSPLVLTSQAFIMWVCLVSVGLAIWLSSLPKLSELRLLSLVLLLTRRKPFNILELIPLLSAASMIRCRYGCKGGTLDGIIDTVSAQHSLVPLIDLLKSNGKIVLVGAPEKLLELPVFPLLAGRKTVGGSYVGLKETQEMMDFAAKHNAKPDTEVISVDYVNTTMERLLRADVKYHFVIDIGNTLKPATS